MQRLLILTSILVCLVGLGYAQSARGDGRDTDSPPPFEVYGLASTMRVADGDFPSQAQASGARTGFVWRRNNLGLVADLGFHQYSDRSGSTSMAPFMLGARVYSDERLRTAFFGEFLGGAYRWTMRGPNVNFTQVKGIMAAGGGMDIRVTPRVVFRVFELQIIVKDVLTGSMSTGIAYRFGGR